MVILSGDAIRASTKHGAAGARASAHRTERAVSDANAKLRFTGVTPGARLQKEGWEASLEGVGSEGDVLGICFGDGAEHFHHQSLQAHVGPGDAQQPVAQGRRAGPGALGVRGHDRCRADCDSC